MQVKALIKYLQDHHNDDDVIAMSIWTVEDVLGLAKEIGVVLTPGQAADVLDEAEHRFDANIGISWDILEFHIQTILHYDEEGG